MHSLWFELLHYLNFECVIHSETSFAVDRTQTLRLPSDWLDVWTVDGTFKFKNCVTNLSIILIIFASKLHYHSFLTNGFIFRSHRWSRWNKTAFPTIPLHRKPRAAREWRPLTRKSCWRRRWRMCFRCRQWCAPSPPTLRAAGRKNCFRTSRSLPTLTSRSSRWVCWWLGVNHWVCGSFRAWKLHDDKLEQI